VESVEHGDGRPLVYFASGYRKLDETE